MMINLRPVTLGNFYCRVGRSGIDYDEFIDKVANAFQAVTEVLFLVLHDHTGGDRRRTIARPGQRIFANESIPWLLTFLF